MMLGVNLREAFNSEIRLKFEFEPSLTYCTLSYNKSVVFLHRSEALHSSQQRFRYAPAAQNHRVIAVLTHFVGDHSDSNG